MAVRQPHRFTVEEYEADVEELLAAGRISPTAFPDVELPVSEILGTS
jgi:hypothetical protein